MLTAEQESYFDTFGFLFMRQLLLTGGDGRDYT